MSKGTPRLPPTPKNCSSPVRLENAGSVSSGNSDSPIHRRTLTGADSPDASKIKPSSWDDSDDDLPITLEKVNPKGHIYSSESPGNRKSVAAEINELKKQYFQTAILEAESEIEDLREQVEMSLKNDRRQSPARVRRRTKSSSSSSTAMDVTAQSSPKREDELMPQYDTILENVENISPLLELDSKFYLEKFFADLRRKRISVMESSIKIVNEKVEDFQEVAIDDSDEFIDFNDTGYYNRTCRKLSQILEVEENKKDSEKESEELSENTTLFLKLSRNSDDDYSPLHTARSKKDEKVYENEREGVYKLKPSSATLSNSNRVISPRACLSERQPKNTSSEMHNKVISLTAKTGNTCLNSLKWEDATENSNDLQQIHDDDEVNWSLIENLKLDLMRSSENPTPREYTRRERNSGSRSNESARDGSSQSPRFKINVGKESGRSLKIEEIKTPKSSTQKSAGSERSIKDRKSSCGSAGQEVDNVSVDLKSPSLESRTSNASLELHDIILNRVSNINRDALSTDRTIEALNQVETSNRSELSYSSNQEQNSRSANSKSSRSSRSNRLSSKVNESRVSSERSEKIKLTERTESRKSLPVSSRTELELHRKVTRPQSEKSYYRKQRNRESLRSTPRGARTSETSSSCAEEFRLELKNLCESLNENARISGLESTEIQGISSNRSERILRSQNSSKSELILSESLDKSVYNNSIEELKTLLNVPSENSEMIEECEDKVTQRSKNDSESDGRLSIINEVSSENIVSDKIDESPKTPKQSAAANSEEAEGEKLDEHRVEDETKPKRPATEVLWNDLIETFSEDQNQPFNWQENFLGFLDTNQKNSIISERELELSEKAMFLQSDSGVKAEDDFILSRRITESVLQSPQKVEKMSSPKKSPEKREDFSKQIYLDIKNNFKDKMKNNDDAQNLYYFGVEETGKFGIGECGDVTCWNLGASHALEEGKPKGSGDGVLPQYRIQSPLLNGNDTNTQKKVWMNYKNINNSDPKMENVLTNDDLSLIQFHRHDLKPSKSDTCLNTSEPGQHPLVDFTNIKKSASKQDFPVTENRGKRKRKAVSSVSSEQYSTSDYDSDETDSQELEFESVRRSASLTNIACKSEFDKLESNENLYNSRSRLYDKMRKEVKYRDSNDLSKFVVAKKKENKTAAKSNWLIFKQSKTCHRANKRSKSRLKIDKSLIKNESNDYLSFRSRQSVPMLKLRNSNCFQNFYKRVISVFCVTSDSSLPTSK